MACAFPQTLTCMKFCVSNFYGIYCTQWDFPRYTSNFCFISHLRPQLWIKIVSNWKNLVQIIRLITETSNCSYPFDFQYLHYIKMLQSVSMYKQLWSNCQNTKVSLGSNYTEVSYRYNCPFCMTQICSYFVICFHLVNLFTY